MVDLKYRYWLPGFLAAVIIVGGIVLLRSPEQTNDPSLAATVLQEPSPVR